MTLLDRAPPIPPYPLTDHERECLIFQPINPPRPDAEMAGAFGEDGRERSSDGGRSRQRDGNSDVRGPRRDRGPQSDHRRDPSREISNPRRDESLARSDEPATEAVAPVATELVEPSQMTTTSPQSVDHEVVADEAFGAGVE